MHGWKGFATAVRAADVMLFSRLAHDVLPPCGCCRRAWRSAVLQGNASLPNFTAVVDSGCSAHSTESIDRLVNPRQCFEVFGASNGRLARATSIGDLPVLAKSASGAFVQFTIKDVRHIPDFCYTLLSVRQLWDQHRIDARFADERVLKLP